MKLIRLDKIVALSVPAAMHVVMIKSIRLVIIIYPQLYSWRVPYRGSIVYDPSVDFLKPYI